jgi:hypothetical protein
MMNTTPLVYVLLPPTSNTGFYDVLRMSPFSHAFYLPHVTNFLLTCQVLSSAVKCCKVLKSIRFFVLILLLCTAIIAHFLDLARNTRHRLSKFKTTVIMYNA